MINKIEWLIKKSKEDKEVTMTKTHENLFDIILQEYKLIDNEPILYSGEVGLLLVNTQRILRLPKIHSEEGICTRRFDLTILQSSVTQVLVGLISSLYDVIESTDVLKEKISEDLKKRIDICFKKSEEAKIGYIERPQLLSRLV